MVRPTAHADEYDKTHTQEVLLDPNSELFPRATPAMNAVTLAQSYNRLQLIYRLGKAICEETELDRVLALVQEALIRLIALERCFIATFDGHGRLEALTTHNIVLDHGLENWPVSKSLIRRVLKDRVALLSADAQQDTQFEGIHSIGIHNIHSVMCIPLGSEGSCIGLIYADHRGKTGSFSPDDLLFVTALSHYIYLGIHNANKIAIALEKQRISDDRVVALQQDLLRNDIKIIGQSKSLQESLRLLERVASTNLPVLLLGERGTGKELFAKALHKRNTQRANKIFMPANIAAFTETLMEAELFGTVRGAFTGAIDKPGKLELADGGTLFLDEIADIPLSAQTKLLRVLQDGVLERVGGTKHVKTDFRLVSATNKDLDEAIRNGKFREDLYDRIKGITIRIPPLRERMEDIPLLVLDTLGKLGSSKVFEPSAIELMQAYSWPGNIRQLIRFVEVVDVLCDSQEVRAKDLQPLIRISPPQVSSSLIKTEFPTLKTLVAQVERGHSALRADSSTFTPCSGTGSWGG